MPLHKLYGVVVQSERTLPAPAATNRPDIIITEHDARLPSALPANSRGYSYHRLDNGAIHVSWSDLFDFMVSADGRSIDIYADAASDTDAVYTYLLSQVVSIALLQQNIESLHASAISLGERATVLLGDSGYGKSTLTAALMQAGAKLITDDLLVLRLSGEAYSATPGAHRIKLAGDTARQLHIDWPNTPLTDGSGKNIWSVPAELCVGADTAIERIIVLQPHASHVELQPINFAGATRALLAATYNPLHTEPARLQQLLARAEHMARVVPMFTLTVPRSLQALPRVIDLLQ